MTGIEKYNPNRINKDVAPHARFRNGDRMFLPGDLLDALNCRYKTSNGAMGVLEGTPGNLLKSFSLPAGTNQTIGRFVNTKYNTFIYFVWNSNLDHRVVEWDPQAGTFLTLLSGSSLGFSRDHLITQGGCIDDTVIFNDGLVMPREFDLVRARAGGYIAPYSKYQLSVATRPPLDSPAVSIVTDETFLFNNIAKTTFQFAHRFVYNNNKQSTFGPLSGVVWIRPTENPDDNTNNAIDVTVNFPIELTGIVKQIDIIFREGNTGNYFIFAEIKNPTEPTHTARFFNSGRSLPVSTDDQLRLYDYIPPVTKALEIVENRIFTPLNKVGFNVDESTFDYGIGLGEEELGDEYVNKRFLKNGGVYGTGMILSDDYGRTTFVKRDKTIKVPWESTANKRRAIDWTLTGTPPAGFTKYRFVLTQNQFHATYFQCYAVPHLYVRDLKEGETDNTQTDTTYNWQGKRFLKMSSVDFTDRALRGWKYIYLQIPLNVPFIPDTSCLVRIIQDNEFIPKYVNIVGVVGDFLILDDEYISIPGTFVPRDGGEPVQTTVRTPIDWSTFPGRIEVFKTLDAEQTIFFEIGESHDIINDEFSVLSGRIYGDTYNLANVPFQFTPVDIIEGDPIEFTTHKVPSSTDDQFIESPSGILSSTIATFPVSIKAAQKRPQTTTPNTPPATVDQSTEILPVYTLDYSKASADYGRPHTILTEEKELDLYSTFGFSNPYIQNSFINGLNSFLAANQYPVSIERGPVRGTANVGGVLLAIHERFTSSLYIGEGFMRQNNDFILTKTDGVVGDDREMLLNYGTINPESIIRVYNHVFWWDGLQGAVVQYTNAGLFPISSYGMTHYFRKKGRDYFPYKDDIKVLTAFDYQNGELLLTLPEVKDEFGGIIIAGETWAFNFNSREWSTRYSFVGEMYANTPTEFVSFKNGALWLHNVNPIHNNFYGVQYTRKHRFVCNPTLGKNKRYLNIHIEGALCTDPDSDEFKPVKAYTREGQESFTPACDFEFDEGKWNGPILKDINTPDVPEDRLAVRSGDDIVSNYLEIEIENDRTDKAQVSEINVIFKTEEFST